MKKNIFEGSRRLAHVIAGLMILVGFSVIYENKPTIYLYYSIKDFGKSPEEIDSDKYYKGDTYNESAREHRYIKTSNGILLCANFRFEPVCYKDINKNLVTFKIIDGMIYGNSPYSPEVAQYTRNTVDNFNFPSETEKRIEKEYFIDRSKQIASDLAILLFCVLIWYGFVRIIGWIVRGFLGIPRGLDNREEMQ
jgi:hypothetical protein